MSKLLIIGLQYYQRYISIYTRASCRFYPTCSQYAIDALQHFGLLRGIWLILCRLVKCHPFHPGGVDMPRGHQAPLLKRSTK